MYVCIIIITTSRKILTGNSTKKWKNLKDTFVRVKGDIEVYVASGSERKKRRKVWKHYENMKFLNDKQNKKK